MTVKPMAKCECGQPLPEHLLFALNRHTCLCGRRFRVENAKTPDAHFIPEKKES